jgi:hypothetical protein
MFNVKKKHTLTKCIKNYGFLAYQKDSECLLVTDFPTENPYIQTRKFYTQIVAIHCGTYSKRIKNA